MKCYFRDRGGEIAASENCVTQWSARAFLIYKINIYFFPPTFVL